ncbi:coiled-coil domain-containing protein 190 [Rhynchonycteris naso]
MDRHMVRRLLHKQLDLERKQAKQAEARLGQHLQRLQAAHLCQLRQLTREQTQLERQLQRLQQDPTDPGPTASPAEERGASHEDEAVPGDAHLQPGLSAECVEGPHSQSSVPTFPELFARAVHAHYLRHRVPPESERLLSISEIFGHRDPAIQDRLPSRSPLL